MIDDRVLDEIEKRASKATPGEWKMDDSVVLTAINSETEHIAMSNYGLGLEKCNANADFIAHAREDVPALIAEVRSLKAEINRVAVFLAIHGVDGYKLNE